MFTLCMNEITLQVSVVLANKSGSNTFLTFVKVIVIYHLNKFQYLKLRYDFYLFKPRG